MSLQKCADLSDCEQISACATETPILVEIGLSYPILSYPIPFSQLVILEIEAVFSCENSLRCTDRTLLSSMHSGYDVLLLPLPAVCWRVW